MEKLDVISQIENELTWRIDELTFLKNQLSLIDKEENKKRFRKSLVVMLYSYYEGFSKSAFHIYIDAINSQEIQRGSVNLSIRTISMNDVFLAYGNKEKKDMRFNRLLPDDSKLHSFSRQISFVKHFQEFLSEVVSIPENVVDTESNLKPIVLKKILYRLGFPLDCIREHESTINKLISVRNAVAHGSKKSGLSENDYIELELSVIDLMESINQIIKQAIFNDEFLARSEDTYGIQDIIN